MVSVELGDDLKSAIEGETTPKFLATFDDAGQPNCVPVTTLTPLRDDILVFGEFMMRKTRRNLLGNNRVGISVITKHFESWNLEGVFLGFEEAGEAVDLINNSRLFRYNAYTRIRAAGRIQVTSVSSKLALGSAGLLARYVETRVLAGLLRRGKPSNGKAPSANAPSFADRLVMPSRVAEKFRRLAAVRAVGYRDTDGAPRVFSTVVCVAAGANRLLLSDALFRLHRNSIPPAARVAVAVITKDPVAYQVKGTYQGCRAGVGIVDLDECYSASPPLVGERLD